MSFKATTLFLFTVCALLAPVKSAPTFHSLNVRQYDSQNMTSNSTNSPSSTLTNTSTSDFLQQDGLAAQKMNAEFATIKATDPCLDDQMACVNSSFAQCVAGQWELSPCSFADLNCYALPRGDKPGLSLVCDTQANALQRFVSAGVQGGVTGNDTTDSTDPDDCDDDDGGDDDSGDDCDDPSDSTLPVAATATSDSPTPSPTGVPAIPSQANNTSVAAVTGSTTPAISLTTSTLYRRQILTSSSLSASTPATSPDAIPTPSSNISSSLPITTSSASTTATPSSSSTNGIVSPTVVIGTNGIVTVTVVSTVTVSATDCAAAGASTDAASTLVPSFGTAFTLLSPTGSPLTPTSLSASTSLSAPTSTPSSLISSSATLPSPVATSTPITTPTTASFGFGFTFSTPAATTPTPAPTNTPTSSLNISELLTATA